MATFKAVVRKKRADGFYPVYIRIVHRSRMGYIKTDKIVSDKQILKSGEIKDAVVNDFCYREIPIWQIGRIFLTILSRS